MLYCYHQFHLAVHMFLYAIQVMGLTVILLAFFIDGAFGLFPLNISKMT